MLYVAIRRQSRTNCRQANEALVATRRVGVGPGVNMLLERSSKNDAISCRRWPLERAASQSVWPLAVSSETQAQWRLGAMFSGRYVKGHWGSETAGGSAALVFPRRMLRRYGARSNVITGLGCDFRQKRYQSNVGGFRSTTAKACSHQSHLVIGCRSALRAKVLFAYMIHT